MVILLAFSVLGCAVCAPPAPTPTVTPTPAASPTLDIAPSTVPANFRPGVWPWPFDTSRDVHVRYTKLVYENGALVEDIIETYDYKAATLASGQPGTYFIRNWGVRFADTATTVEGYTTLSGQPVAGTGVMKHYRYGGFEGQEAMTDEQYLSYDIRQDAGLASATNDLGDEDITVVNTPYVAHKYSSPDGARSVWMFPGIPFPVKMEIVDGNNRVVYEMESVEFI